MFGRHSGYIRNTMDKVRTTRVDDRIKVIAPEDCEVSHTHFLPFIAPQEPEEPLKSRHKRRVFYREVDGEGFYLKKYSYRFTQRHFAPLRGFIWTIPLAQRQMQKMLFLRECGAGVAEPVMTIVRRYCLIKQESLLVMRECPGVLLKRFIKKTDDFDRRLNAIAQTFHFLHISHSNRIHHGDLASHNFIITPQDELMAIDLDERKTKWLGQVGNRKELKRWVQRSIKILKLQSPVRTADQIADFERMLEQNYPAALNYYRKLHEKTQTSQRT